MDPTINLCSSSDILSNELIYYTNTNTTQLTPSYTQCANDSVSSKYCDINLYNTLHTLKNYYDHPLYNKVRDIVNPFENIGKSIFSNRAGVKLANIDAVLNITNYKFTFDTKYTNDNFTFCDIASGPGAFTEYLQYRFPNAKGYGITIRHKQNDWNQKIINMKNFDVFYGPDNTGDLYINCLNFIVFVKKNKPAGVDLITGDGAFDSVYDNQEFLSSRLLLTQIIVGIDCTKINGNFVVKVLDTVTEFSAQIIYILSLCFKSIILFKPASSRPANSERYLVCLNRREIVQNYLILLKNALPYYNSTTYLKSLFSNDLPDDYINWLKFHNNFSINLQLLIGRNTIYFLKYILPFNPNLTPVKPYIYYINKILQTDNLNDIIKSKILLLKNNYVHYDIHKFLIVWNLPDNTDYKYISFQTPHKFNKSN